MSSAPERGAAARFFAGDWTLRRRIADRQAGCVGRMIGTAAVVAASGDRFALIEQGDLRFGAHVGPAHQRYGLRIEDAGRVTLTDGADVVLAAADLSAPRAVFRHDCGDDVYLGRMARVSDDRWRLAWRIRGPRKDLVIATRYQRIKS